MHRIVVLVLMIVLFLAVSFAQPPATQSEGPRFEVVAIKPTPETTSPIAFTISGARVQISGYPLLALLMKAFRVQLPQVDVRRISLDSEYFEIQATLPAGATSEQVPEMLQAMLAERFKLAYHRETREYRVNVLTVGKSGMKLPRLPDGTRAPSTSNILADGTLRTTRTGKVSSLFLAVDSGGLQLADETGLDGIYTWVQDRPPHAPGIDAYRESLQDSFKAMIEAAGLKLETRKVPKETIIVFVVLNDKALKSSNNRQLPARSKAEPYPSRSQLVTTYSAFRPASTPPSRWRPVRLGVGQALTDDLDVHGRLAGLAGALAINPMLTHQHQRIRQQIQGDGQTPALQAHAKLVLFEGVFAIVIDGHAS